MIDISRSYNSLYDGFVADVAELVDAHASGACIRKDVRVRFPPSAPSVT